MVKRASLEKEDLQQRWQGVITEGTQYSIFGSVVTVVEIDCLTGEVRIYLFNWFSCLIYFKSVVEDLHMIFDAGEMINVGIEKGLNSYFYHFI